MLDDKATLMGTISIRDLKVVLGGRASLRAPTPLELTTAARRDDRAAPPPVHDGARQAGSVVAQVVGARVHELCARTVGHGASDDLRCGRGGAALRPTKGRALTLRPSPAWRHPCSVGQERHPAISLRRSDSFGTLIAKIASTAVHRYSAVTAARRAAKGRRLTHRRCCEARAALPLPRRIFIIDDNNAPIGVVGTIDVLRGLMAHSQVAS